MRSNRELQIRLYAYDQYLNMILENVEVIYIEIAEERYEEIYKSIKQTLLMIFFLGRLCSTNCLYTESCLKKELILWKIRDFVWLPLNVEGIQKWNRKFWY